MKIRYCVSLLLLCAATIFSKSTTVKAEDKYYKFLEKYFTIEEKYKSKWGQQDGFTYLSSAFAVVDFENIVAAHSNNKLTQYLIFIVITHPFLHSHSVHYNN